MNPIYSIWKKCGAESRYEFLEILLGNYNGMLESAIKDIKKEKKRKRRENSGNLLFGIGAIIRNIWKCFW